MHIELDGQPVPCALDAKAIAEVLATAAKLPQAFVSVRRSDDEMLQAAVGTGQPLTLLRADASGQNIVVPETHFSLHRVANLFAMYAADDPRWRRVLAWDQNDNERLAAEALARGRVWLRRLAWCGLGLIALLLTAAVVAERLPLVGALKLFGALLALGLYFKWLGLFFSRIRPWLATRLGEALGVTILGDEATLGGGGHRGSWKIDGPAPLWMVTLVFVLEGTVLVPAVMVPFGGTAAAMVYIVNGHF